jgi:hypothetical protein
MKHAVVFMFVVFAMSFGFVPLAFAAGKPRAAQASGGAACVQACRSRVGTSAPRGTCRLQCGNYNGPVP